MKKYNSKTKYFYFILLFFIVSALLLSLKNTNSVKLANDAELKPDSELIYYIDVLYNGVDENGTNSNTKTLTNIKGDYIEVEDYIPYGQEFDSFVKTDNGTIGAVSLIDNSPCQGYVVDDTKNETSTSYHGLHYDEQSRKVYFKVKNLIAGCKLTVGVKTMTSKVDDENTQNIEIRRDYYSIAFAKEAFQTVKSPILHTWSGSKSKELYTVSFSYNNAPENAPELIETMSYAAGSIVNLPADINVEGYSFSGWTSNDVTISKNQFIMPEKNISFIGSFDKKNQYNVTYEISKNISNSNIYNTEKLKYSGEYVNDSFKIGDKLEGYILNRIESDDVFIDEHGGFIMPNKDVVIKEIFEPVTYKVSYSFYDDIKPDNSEELLPQTRYYEPGETVYLEEEPYSDYYEFLGWYQDSSFTMPNHDVIIYGEWKSRFNYFNLDISIEEINPKQYGIGDPINYQIIITNNNEFTVKEVLVREINDEAFFNENEKYTLKTNHLAYIDNICSNCNIILYATHIVNENDLTDYTNQVQIISAEADGNYILTPPTSNTRRRIKSTRSSPSNSSSLNSSIKPLLEIVVPSFHATKTIYFKITDNNDFQTSLKLKTQKNSQDQSDSVYVSLDPGTYTIKEIIPQELSITSVTGDLNSNGGSLIIEDGYNYQITFNNSYTKKGFFHSFGGIKRVINLGGT